MGGIGLRIRIALAFVISVVGLSSAQSFYDCAMSAVDIERAVQKAREYTGKPVKVWLSKSKRTGECFWKVKGLDGYVTIDAKTGELLKFYRNKK